MTVLRAALVALALPILLAACGGTTPQAGPPDGMELFKKHCAACHGANGKGVVAKIDMTSPEWQKSHPDEAITKTVEEGIPAKSMPSFATVLKEDAIKAIIADAIRKFGKEAK